jgi:hypothetical protein
LELEIKFFTSANDRIERFLQQFSGFCLNNPYIAASIEEEEKRWLIARRFGIRLHWLQRSRF